MQGITLYIILGILVVAIILFLFVSSLLDRKKRKKILAEAHIKKNNEKSSNMKVAVFLAFVIKQNQTLLDKFVPSIGVLKMSDIRKKARKSLEIVEKSQPYVFLKQTDTLIVKIFERLKVCNSNVWKKNFVNETNKIMTMSLASYKLRTKDAEVKTILNKIKKVYS